MWFAKINIRSQVYLWISQNVRFGIIILPGLKEDSWINYSLSHTHAHIRTHKHAKTHTQKRKHKHMQKSSDYLYCRF